MPGPRRLLRQAAPDARLLVLLRDPVERFRSGRTLAENRFTVGSTARAAANAAFNRGIYADQLLRSGRPSHASRSSSCSTNAASLTREQSLARTFAFLGLDVTTRSTCGRRVNASRGAKVTLSAWQEACCCATMRPRTSGSAALVPDLDLSLWARPS